VDKLLASVQKHFAENFTASALRVLIVLWALFVIGLALSTDNVWLLASILAYEILP